MPRNDTQQHDEEGPRNNNKLTKRALKEFFNASTEQPLPIAVQQAPSAFVVGAAEAARDPLLSATVRQSSDNQPPLNARNSLWANVYGRVGTEKGRGAVTGAAEVTTQNTGEAKQISDALGAEDVFVSDFLDVADDDSAAAQMPRAADMDVVSTSTPRSRSKNRARRHSHQA